MRFVLNGRGSGYAGIEGADIKLEGDGKGRLGFPGEG